MVMASIGVLSIPLTIALSRYKAPPGNDGLTIPGIIELIPIVSPIGNPITSRTTKNREN